MTDVIPANQVDADAIIELAQTVFDTIINYLESCRIEVPERRTIVVGELVVDDDEGVFGLIYGGNHLGPPGNEQSSPIRGDTASAAVFDIELWRKVSTRGGGGAKPRRPSSDSITDEAKIAMRDSWALLRAAKECDKLGIGVIASTAPHPPAGGLQAVSLNLQLQVT